MLPSKNLLLVGDALDPCLVLSERKGEKALNGIQWEVAHLLPLNYAAPIAFLDATICVRKLPHT